VVDRGWRVVNTLFVERVHADFVLIVCLYWPRLWEALDDCDGGVEERVHRKKASLGGKSRETPRLSSPPHNGPLDHHRPRVGRTSTRGFGRRRAGQSPAHPHESSLTLQQTEQALQEQKQQSKLVFRRITPNSEPRCSIESGAYTLQSVLRRAVSSIPFSPSG
jgi:hypothetical protein